MRNLTVILLLGWSLQAQAIRCDFETLEHGSPKLFHQFLTSLKKTKSAEQLAPYIKYPLTLNIKPEKQVIQNRNQVQRFKNEIFTEKVKKALKTAKTRFVYCDQQGVMLGKGNLWVRYAKSQYKIIAINP